MPKSVNKLNQDFQTLESNVKKCINFIDVEVRKMYDLVNLLIMAWEKKFGTLPEGIHIDLPSKEVVKGNPAPFKKEVILPKEVKNLG